MEEKPKRYEIRLARNNGVEEEVIDTYEYLHQAVERIQWGLMLIGMNSNDVMDYRVWDNLLNGYCYRSAAVFVAGTPTPDVPKL